MVFFRGVLGDQWPELLAILFQASQSPEAGLRETAFRIFTTTPGIIEKQHQDAVISVFSKGFKDDNIAVCLEKVHYRLLGVTISLRMCSLGANFCYGSLRRDVPLDP